jgi:hypothetical protein
VAVLGEDLHGERRGVRWAATRARCGTDGDSPVLESEVDNSSA